MYQGTALEEAAARAVVAYIQSQQKDPGPYSLIAMCAGEARPELVAMQYLQEAGYHLKRVWMIDVDRYVLQQGTEIRIPYQPPKEIMEGIKAILRGSASGSASASLDKRVKCLTFPAMNEEMEHRRIDYATTHCIAIHFQMMITRHPGYNNNMPVRYYLPEHKVDYETAKAIEREDIKAIKHLVHSDVGKFFKLWMGFHRKEETWKGIGYMGRDGRFWEVTPDHILSDAGFYNSVNEIQTKAREAKHTTSGGKKKDLKTSGKSTRKEKNVQR